MDNYGNLVPDANLHVIMAMLNIELNELIEKRLDQFDNSKGKAQVHLDYHKKRRINRLY